MVVNSYVNFSRLTNLKYTVYIIVFNDLHLNYVENYVVQVISSNEVYIAVNTIVFRVVHHGKLNILALL